MGLTDRGDSERFKASIHLGMFGLAVAAGLYNWARLQKEPDWGHRVNVGVYGVLALFEAKQVLSHMGPR